MSSRTVWNCDLCGVDNDTIYSFPGSSVTSTLFPSVDIGPCCLGRPIRDLQAAMKSKQSRAQATVVPTPKAAT